MQVYFYGNVLEYTNAEKIYETADCSTISELIENLGSRYGAAFKFFLLTEETCFFLVNGTGLMMTGGFNTKLKQDDKIEILPFAEAG